MGNGGRGVEAGGAGAVGHQAGAREYSWRDWSGGGAITGQSSAGVKGEAPGREG